MINNGAAGATSTFAIDLDGDGDVDVLSSSWNDSTIAWHENSDGRGINWTEHKITTDAEVATSVFGIDVDSDGDIDVLSASVQSAFVDESTLAW